MTEEGGKGRGFSFPPRQPVHGPLAGRYGSRLRGRGLNFEEIRLYLRGDNIRNIDWKVTARTCGPHGCVYSEEHDRALLASVKRARNTMKSTRRREAIGNNLAPLNPKDCGPNDGHATLF